MWVLPQILCLILQVKGPIPKVVKPALISINNWECIGNTDEIKSYINTRAYQSSSYQGERVLWVSISNEKRERLERIFCERKIVLYHILWVCTCVLNYLMGSQFIYSPNESMDLSADYQNDWPNQSCVTHRTMPNYNSNKLTKCTIINKN